MGVSLRNIHGRVSDGNRVKSNRIMQSLLHACRVSLCCGSNARCLRVRSRNPISVSCVNRTISALSRLSPRRSHVIPQLRTVVFPANKCKLARTETVARYLSVVFFTLIVIHGMQSRGACSRRWLRFFAANSAALAQCLERKMGRPLIYVVFWARLPNVRHGCRS